MNKTMVAALASAFVALAQPLAAQSSPQTIERTISSGALRGLSNGGVSVFKGIPYAQPPVGSLRWRPPQPLPAWSDVRDASAYGNDCMQNPFEYDTIPSKLPKSEDCLYLNVWAPAAKPANPQPVMVWIHGGGLTIGSGSPVVFDGSGFAQKGVLLVTLNYRLGRFGFFAHPALVAEHPDEPTGDYGLMDQIAALKWVKANIAAFGGDPNNVTVFGESSGGASILRLMLSPAARGLFAHAIVESGGGREHWARLDHDVVDKSGPHTGGFRAGETFAREMGIEGDGADAAAALRALSADKVLGDISFFHAEAEDYSGPMIDGTLVPYDVDEGFAAGKEQNIPLIVGSNDDELGSLPGIMAHFASDKIVDAFGDRGAGLEALYDGKTTRSTDLMSDTLFVEPARFVAQTHAANGRPTFFYRFGYVAESKREPDAGARHTTEIPFVFGTLEQAGPAPTAADRAMSGTIQDYWIAFAKSGDPNGASRPAWPAFGSNDPKLMLFTEAGAAASDDPEAARLDYLAQSYSDPTQRAN